MGATLRIEGDERLRAARLSLVAGLGIFATKALAAWASDSTAALSDALESSVNVAAAAMLFASLRFAVRPADRGHPYGHGKVEFLSAGAEGALVAVAALWIAVEAIGDLLRGVELRRIDLGVAGLALAAAGNAWLGRHLLAVAHRTRSAALEADARHVLTDVWTSVGVVAGLLAVWLSGLRWLDPVVALAVATQILRQGVRLLRAAFAGLVDAADDETLDEVCRRLEADRAPAWIDVHGLRATRAGASLHADLHLVVPRYWSADQLHLLHDQVEEALGPLLDEAGSVVVHMDPCRPRACGLCSLEGCPVRSAPGAPPPAITRERATRTDREADPLVGR